MTNYIKKHFWLQSVLWCILLVLFWEISVTTGLANRYLLPSFSSVIRELFSLLRTEKFLLQIGNSLLLITKGFVISVIAAMALAGLASIQSIFRSFVKTMSIIFTPLPAVAVLPLVIMIFGINEESMIVLIMHSVVWPLIINVLNGISIIPEIFKAFGQNIGMPKYKIVIQIYLMSAFPNIITGLRIGWGRAWRALISAEMVFGMIGNLGGIGYFIYTNRAYGNMTRVMCGIIVIAVLGVFVETLLFGAVENLTVKKWGMIHEQ